MTMEYHLFTYRACVVSIYDGDTIRVNIDLGFNTWIMNVPIRLAGLDAPEVRGLERAEGLLAREWLLAMIPIGSGIFIKTDKDSREKFGRYLATIHLPDGADVNQRMINEGFAIPYHGEKR